jgi:hypothetical protein
LGDEANSSPNLFPVNHVVISQLSGTDEWTVLSARPVTAFAPPCVSRDERDPSTDCPVHVSGATHSLNISSNSHKAPIPSGYASSHLVPYVISLGLCKQKNGRSLKISGLSVGRISSRLVQVLTTFLYPLYFVYFSGTSSTTAQWHLCLLVMRFVCHSCTAALLETHKFCWYSLPFALTNNSITQTPFVKMGCI